MRTFIAFDVGDDIRAGLRAAQRAMGRIASVRWVKVESIHLTLKFIGEIEDRLLPSVFEIMRSAVADVAPFEFEVRGLGWFPKGRRPRVLWAGVEGDGGTLPAIAARLNEGLAEVGVSRENRPFRPHLTLGRVKGRLGTEVAEEAFERVRRKDFGVAYAGELVLYMSELHPDGARYTRLGSVELSENMKGGSLNG
ncbi:MAG: RNA 2',3'-cyclic phosphodiesterase [Planctomycetota bacterium]|jgi:2'-5' RNA ligase